MSTPQMLVKTILDMRMHCDRMKSNYTHNIEKIIENDPYPRDVIQIIQVMSEAIDDLCIKVGTNLMLTFTFPITKTYKEVKK